MTTVRIGTRGSRLAMTQSAMVARALEAANPGLRAELVKITTSGDRLRRAPLPEVGGKGLFTREIEERLLAGDIHLAVHSLKDLPTDLPEGLALLAVPERAPANDALVSPGGLSLAELPPGSRVGTSSPRRAAQLLAVRPDLEVVPIRGNLDTRLRKLASGEYDAIVVALAGLERLGLRDARCHVLSFEEMLPARAVLKALGGGCALPLGTYAEVSGQRLAIRAVVASEDGKRGCRAEASGPADELDHLSRQVAARLLEEGAADLLHPPRPPS